MVNKLKAIAVIIGLCLCGFLIFKVVYLQKKMDSIQTDLTSELQKANLVIGRAQTELADTKKFLGNLDKSIQEDIKAHRATVLQYGEILARNEGKGGGTITIVKEIPIVTVVDGKVVPLTSYPFSFQDFRLSMSGDAVKRTFQYQLNQKFEVLLAETRNKNGASNHYVELYELDGKERVSKLTVEKFNVTKSDASPLKPQFNIWDPKLDIQFGVGMGSEFKPILLSDLGVSVMSYGSPGELSWRFLRGGIGINQSGIQLSLSPAQYNIAQPIPLINNLWITPSIGYTLDQSSFLINLGIAATL